MVAKNQTAEQYGAIFDTISVCLSKGLGCPVGSVLVGSKIMIDNAFRVRKMLGGGMRQAGYLAAAGIYALDNHVNRLTIDHKKAKELENVLIALPYIKKVETVETNIIIFYLNDTVNQQHFLQLLEGKNIYISTMGEGKLRIVTHLDYTDEMHDRFLTTLRELEIRKEIV